MKYLRQSIIISIVLDANDPLLILRKYFPSQRMIIRSHERYPPQKRLDFVPEAFGSHKPHQLNFP